MSLEQPVEPEHQAKSAARRVLEKRRCVVVVVISYGIFQGVALAEKLLEARFYMPPPCLQLTKISQFGDICVVEAWRGSHQRTVIQIEIRKLG